MRKLLDLTGQVFGRLTVIEFSHRADGQWWKCQCSCGNTLVVSSSHLRAGEKGTRSCGCLNREVKQTRHGSLEEQFWDKVHKFEGEKCCWVWMGIPDKDGYGRIKHKKKMMRAHHISWRIHFGEIPAGLQVLHRCDNPPCVRPDHLWLGTQGDNMRDRSAKGRWKGGRKKNTESTSTNTA